MNKRAVSASVMEVKPGLSARQEALTTQQRKEIFNSTIIYTACLQERGLDKQSHR